MSKVSVDFRCSIEYKTKVLTAAKSKGMSVSQYVMNCIDSVGQTNVGQIDSVGHVGQSNEEVMNGCPCKEYEQLAIEGAEQRGMTISEYIMLCIEYEQGVYTGYTLTKVETFQSDCDAELREESPRSSSNKE
jgi:hypothetical protein